MALSYPRTPLAAIVQYPRHSRIPAAAAAYDLLDKQSVAFLSCLTEQTHAARSERFAELFARCKSCLDCE
jgi:hypothetical protein